MGTAGRECRRCDDDVDPRRGVRHSVRVGSMVDDDRACGNSISFGMLIVVSGAVARRIARAAMRVGM